MKTQRPRDRVNQRQSPDGSSLSGGSTGMEDGAPQENGAEASARRNSPPTLPPKRKAARPTQPPSKSAWRASSELAKEGAAVADAETPAASTPKPGAPVAQREVPQSTPVQPEVPSTASRVLTAFITYENVIWFAIFAIAVLSRFWDVGNRALHHDESLHAVYSRNLYSGIGYTHDPMMHGPLQFHYIAIMFWLFGTSDATVRYASIVCGLFVVMSPFFLRRQMGRLAAIICGFLLLVSPSMLYFSRMDREDAIYSGMEMIMIVGLWRFLSERKPRDFYIFAAGLSLMYTIKESAYLTTAVLGILFLLLFAFQAGWAVFGATAAYGAIMGVLALLYKNSTQPGSTGPFTKLPDIPGTNPDYNTIADFAMKFLTHPLVLLSIFLTVIYIATVIALFWMKRSQIVSKSVRSRTALPARAHSSDLSARTRVRPLSGSVAKSGNGATTGMVASSGNGHDMTGEGGETPADSEQPSNGPVAEETPAQAGDGVEKPRTHSDTLWNPKVLRPKRGTLFAHYEEGSLPYMLGGIFNRPSMLVIGFVIFTAIFVVFYSVFFTDVPRGILSGMFGSLGYWMSQQGVARGDQPWFYYFLLVPLYEPIAVFFSVAAAVFFSWRGIRWLIDRFTLRYEDEEPRLGAFNTDRPVPFAKFHALLPLLSGWWLLGVFGIYTWAGEKMPWLMMHITRPAIFFASLFISALVAAVIAHRRQRLAEAGLWDRHHVGPEFYPADRRRLAGARFSLGGALEALGLGVSKRELAYSYPPNSAQYSQGSRREPGSGRGSSNVPPPPQRKQGGARGAATGARAYAIARDQDPPWVAWNRPNALFPFVSYMSLFLLFALAWGFSMSRITYMVEHQEIVNRATGEIATYAKAWGVTWFYPILMIVLTVAFAVWLGVMRVMRYVGLAILAVFLLYEFHSTIQLTYRNPDVATELAVYVQTSPDVTRVMKELQDFSYYTTGAKDVKVIYDSEVSWPMEWYLGDYQNKKFIAAGEPSDDDMATAPVMFLGYNRLTDDKILAKFVAQRYALRWWFPEEWYKNDFLPNQYAKDANGAVKTDANGKQIPASALVQVGDFIHSTSNMITMPENTAALWKYLIYREPPHPLGSTDFVLFVRKDVAQLWHNLQNDPLPTTDVPIQKDTQPLIPTIRDVP